MNWVEFGVGFTVITEPVGGVGLGVGVGEGVGVGDGLGVGVGEGLGVGVGLGVGDGAGPSVTVNAAVYSVGLLRLPIKINFAVVPISVFPMVQVATPPLFEKVSDFTLVHDQALWLEPENL